MNYEKVLKALKLCATNDTPCPKTCPYYYAGDDNIMGCTQRLTADAAKLVEGLTDEVKLLRIIKDVLNQDIEDRDAMLERNVEEVYPEFMKDYKAMKEELAAVYEELEETKQNLRKAQKGNY